MQIIKALSQVITSFITQNVPGLNIRVAFKVKVLRNFFFGQVVSQGYSINS